MNTVVELAEANAQVIFDKVEEHLLFISEFNNFLSSNMYAYLFNVHNFSVGNYRGNLERIPHEKHNFKNMILSNLNKLSGDRKESITNLLDHIEDVPVIKLEMILSALEYKLKLFSSNPVLDFALNFNFSPFLTDFYELKKCSITEDKITAVLSVKQLTDEYLSLCMNDYLQAKRNYKADITATFVSYKLLNRVQVKSAKFEKKFKETGVDNAMLSLHYESHAQEKMKEFIDFKPNPFS